MRISGRLRFLAQMALGLMLCSFVSAGPPIAHLFQAAQTGNLEDLNSELVEIVRQRDRSLTGEQAIHRAVNSRDGDGLRPIQYAAYYGHINIMRRLIAVGADPILGQEQGFSQPMQMAVRRGWTEIVQLLIDRGFSANSRYQSEGNYTLLHVAAFWNQSAVFRLLVERGGYLGVINVNGHTPLQIAEQQQHRELVALIRDLAQQPAAIGPHPGSVELFGSPCVKPRLLGQGFK